MYEPATDADVPALVALINRAYRGNIGSGWSTEEAYLVGDRTTDALLRDDLAKKPAASLLKWQEAGEADIIGCVWLEPVGGSTWYLGSLAIDPRKQNGGLGRTMLKAAEDWARNQGAECIRMSVTNVREALIAWYLRQGYERTGATERFPYGDDRYGKPLRDDLCFVVLEKHFERLRRDKRLL
jgi:ribosomal protein S18 acetylase RimI-like enzyme